MTRIYILRKHEPQSMKVWTNAKTPRAAFTIAGTFAERAECKAAAEKLNKCAQYYIYTVGVVALKEGTA